jgi:hypothetical protein
MKKATTATIAVFLIIGGFFIISKPDNNCVNVYIDYGSLKNNAKSTECLNINGKTNALEILNKANYKIEGTKKYGSSVVCRINGLPDRSIESCETMPPSNAYWAVIIKKKQIVPFTLSEWGWAQKGIDETYLSPGDNLGLVFSSNGELRWP